MDVVIRGSIRGWEQTWEQMAQRIPLNTSRRAGLGCACRSCSRKHERCQRCEHDSVMLCSSDSGHRHMAQVLSSSSSSSAAAADEAESFGNEDVDGGGG